MGWVDKTSNVYWTGSNFTWDGDSWNASSADCTLTEAGTWVEDYRPTKVRITWGGCSLSF